MEDSRAARFSRVVAVLSLAKVQNIMRRREDGKMLKRCEMHQVNVCL